MGWYRKEHSTVLQSLSDINIRAKWPVGLSSAEMSVLLVPHGASCASCAPAQLSPSSLLHKNPIGIFHLPPLSLCDTTLTVWITTNCGKFLKRWEYQTTLPASWEICQEATTVQVEHGTMDWFQIGKGVCKGYILSACLFNLYAEYIMWNAGLDKAQAGIKTARRNINNLRYADDTTLMQKVKRKPKASWWKWKWRVKKLA